MYSRLNIIILVHRKGQGQSIGSTEKRLRIHIHRDTQKGEKDRHKNITETEMPWVIHKITLVPLRERPWRGVEKEERKMKEW